MVNKAVLRGEVYWVNLDPTLGTEIQKTRPALVVSPTDMNAALPRVIIAPITSAGQPLGCRPEVVLTKPSGTRFCWRCWAERPTLEQL
jgi:mRNA interferase MazF